MLLSAVKHATRTLEKHQLDLKSAYTIDVGGTEKVYLETDKLRKDVRSRVRNFASRVINPRHYPLKEVIVTENPLTAHIDRLTFFDKGFNASELATQSDIEADFLEESHIASMFNQFDLVLSFDTLEHVRDPFTFCQNLVRVAKSGGYVYLQTVFSWDYHPSPKDYFRFSPDGLRECFAQSGAEVLECDWDIKEISVFILLRKPETGG